MTQGPQNSVVHCLYHSELRSCVEVEVAVMGSPSLIIRIVSVDIVRQIELGQLFRAQEPCESRGGRPGLPVPNSPCGLCGYCKAN